MVTPPRAAIYYSASVAVSETIRPEIATTTDLIAGMKAVRWRTKRYAIPGLDRLSPDHPQTSALFLFEIFDS